MHGIYELKEMLCEELEEYGKKGDLSTGSLDVVDKLAHAIKNLDKIIESDEEGGSYYDGVMYDGNRSMNRGSYERGGRRSYARGRRYSRTGYSRSDMSDRLRELMQDAPDDRTRMEIQNLVTKIEQM